MSAPRLDDLACVFACTEGFLTAQERDMVPVLCVFDNEEIGSETKQGRPPYSCRRRWRPSRRRWASPPPTTGRCWRTA